MKRTILILVFACISAVAFSQMRIGGNFNVNIDNEHTAFNYGTNEGKENSFVISLNPKIYWNISDKMRFGGRVGFAYGRVAAGTAIKLYADPNTQELSTQEETMIDRAIGWSFSPFFGYKLLSWKIVGIWIEGNLVAGQLFNVGAKLYPDQEWNRSTQYGVQILPVIDIDITEKLALQLHLGILSLGYWGETAVYDNKTVTRNVWDMRKGGFDGLIQGFRDYGIGIVKKF